MREDIVGMLRNAIEHGGNPARVAQSLINSGYPPAEVQQALSYVMGTMQSQQQAQMPQIPHPNAIPSPAAQAYPASPYAQQQAIQAPTPQQFFPKALPVVKNTQQPGTGKLVLMIFILLILIGSLISVIIFKNNIMDLLG